MCPKDIVLSMWNSWYSNNKYFHPIPWSNITKVDGVREGNVKITSPTRVATFFVSAFTSCANIVIFTGDEGYRFRNEVIILLTQCVSDQFPIRIIQLFCVLTGRRVFTHSSVGYTTGGLAGAIFIYFIHFIKTYLTRMTHQPEAVLHEVLPYTTTQLIYMTTKQQHKT